MTAEGPLTAVIDVGSNSVRMVIFSGAGRWPIPVYNERTLCGLGRELPETNRLYPEAVQTALDHLKRFAEVGQAMGVTRWEAVATEAVRVAKDGKAFVKKAEKCLGVPLNILGGDEEAEISALGVVSGIPGADGLMGDLGGGSLEIVALDEGKPAKRASLPFGSLRFPGHGDGRNMDETAIIDKAFQEVSWLKEVKGRTFYPVGGAWRAFAHVHMGHNDYPLHVIHEYGLSRENVLDILDLVGRMSAESLRRIPHVPRARLATLPIAAKLMERLLLHTKPSDVVFSAHGLREGWLYNGLDKKTRAADPLLEACRERGARESRFGIDGPSLMRWTDPLFGDEDAKSRRLREAAAALADIGWRFHPDYRADDAFEQTLHMPLAAISHGERVRLAFMVGARYGGGRHGAVQDKVRTLIADDDLEHAMKVGRALRLAVSVSGGVGALLKQSGVSMNDKSMTLDLSSDKGMILGEVAERRFEALAGRFGRRPVVKTR